jgi:quercetin dioxygenase-like cupin family protein
MRQPVLANSDAYSHQDFDWGTLTWFVARELKNSESMTVGRCILKSGFSNPKHRHPNCDEVLHLVAGRIICGVGEEEFEMGLGDTITIPTDLPHYARNIGNVDAVMLICFSSADRESILVE